jgi:FkbM family methyltransferase
MNQNLKHKMWDLVRPLHSPFTRALRRRLGQNYHEHPEMALPEPEESVQFDVERHLHQYLHVPAETVAQIVVVGACDAGEVMRMHRVYSNAKYVCFEPNPKTFDYLVAKYGHFPWVDARKLALSDTPGRDRFYEMDMPGNGSLLEPDAELWSTTVQWKDKTVTSFEVELSTLDRETSSLASIDLLWMDVQGAEGKVLAGGREALKRTKAVFLEVALVRSPYKGAPLFSELKALLEAAGFMCVALGVGAWNGNGNAFFVRDFDRLICK